MHEIPLLFCPPWINKYYIMDLAPERSLVEWAVRHGHTCFAISYRNPDASMRDATFEDYLLDGPLEAIEVVRSITGAEVVNTIAVCLGGTLSAMGMAYDAALGRRTVNSATLINTHTDFTRPGVLGAFADEPTDRPARAAHGQGGPPPVAAAWRGPSRCCRANDLVFSYVAKNWLMGETPPAFDLLAWNDDGTSMPAQMHGDFLRWFYLENRLAEGRMEIDGTRLDLATVDQPTYVVSAVDDHIVPWASAYETTQLLGGDDNRFVLSHLRPHRRHRQPAEPEGQALDQHRPRRRRRELEGRGPAQRRHLVGRLGAVDRRAGRRPGARPRAARQRRRTPRSATPPAPTCTAERSPPTTPPDPLPASPRRNDPRPDVKEPRWNRT